MKEFLPEVDQWRANGDKVALATVVKVEGSAPRPVGATLAVSSAGDLAGSVSGGCVETAVFEEAHDGERYELFFDIYPPSPTLLIFGAVHVSQALTRFAKQLGFRVIVSDARAKLATVERFPEADEIIQAWPDEALLQVSIEPNTYVAIL